VLVSLLITLPEEDIEQESNPFFAWLEIIEGKNSMQLPVFRVFADITCIKKQKL